MRSCYKSYLYLDPSSIHVISKGISAFVSNNSNFSMHPHLMHKVDICILCITVKGEW